MVSVDVYAAALVLTKRFLTCEEVEQRRKVRCFGRILQCNVETPWPFLSDDREDLEAFASEVGGIDAVLSGVPEIAKFSDSFLHLKRKLSSVAAAVKPLTVRFGINKQQSSDAFMNAELHGFRRALVVGSKAALVVERENGEDARGNKLGYSSFALVFFNPKTAKDASATVVHFANVSGSDFAGDSDLPAPRWRKCRYAS
eukprot:scaffold1130_cov195-Pinguiococcus_pyrenoidosus.AAC.26